MPLPLLPLLLIAAGVALIATDKSEDDNAKSEKGGTNRSGGKRGRPRGKPRSAASKADSGPGGLTFPETPAREASDDDTISNVRSDSTGDGGGGEPDAVEIPSDAASVEGGDDAEHSDSGDGGGGDNGDNVPVEPSSG